MVFIVRILYHKTTKKDAPYIPDLKDGALRREAVIDSLITYKFELFDPDFEPTPNIVWRYFFQFAKEFRIV